MNKSKLYTSPAFLKTLPKYLFLGLLWMVLIGVLSVNQYAILSVAIFFAFGIGYAHDLHFIIFQTMKRALRNNTGLGESVEEEESVFGSGAGAALIISIGIDSGLIDTKAGTLKSFIRSSKMTMGLLVLLGVLSFGFDLFSMLSGVEFATVLAAHTCFIWWTSLADGAWGTFVALAVHRTGERIRKDKAHNYWGAMLTEKEKLAMKFLNGPRMVAALLELTGLGDLNDK